MSHCPVSFILPGRGGQASCQASSLFWVQPQHARLDVQEPLSHLTRSPGNWAASYPCFQDHLLTFLPTDPGTKPFRIQLNSKASTARVHGQGGPHKVKLRLREAQDR